MSNDEHLVKEKEATITYGPQRAVISWAAIFAGLAFVVALKWFMVMFGSAIGLTVADLTNSSLIAEGFGIGTMLWMLFSGFVVFFFGALLTAKMSGSTDESVGLYHGVTLWSLATILMVALTSFGISSLVETGASTVAWTTGIGSQESSGEESAETTEGENAEEDRSRSIVAAGQALAWAGNEFSETELADEIAARLKRETSQFVAQLDTDQSPSLSQEEVRKAIDNIDEETSSEIAKDLVDGDDKGLRKTFADHSNLSEAQINDVVTGMKKEIANSLAAEESEELLAQAEDVVGNMSDGVTQWVSFHGGEAVSQAKARQSIEDLDAETLRGVARSLIYGNTEAAKNKIAINTSLTEENIDTIVQNVSADVNEGVKEFQMEANQVVESVNDYSQALLWGTFIASALALIAATLGGWIGTSGKRAIQSLTKRQHIHKAV